MRVLMTQTEERRDGDTFTRYQKGALVNVSDEEGKRLVDSGKAEEQPDIPTGVATCSARVVEQDGATAILEVSVSLSKGESLKEDPAVVRLESASGVEILDGAPIGEFVKAPACWGVAKGSGSGVVSFLSQATGYESRSATATISPAAKPRTTPDLES